MKKSFTILFFLLLTLTSVLNAQDRVDSIQFFLDEKPLTVNISADFKKLFATKEESPWNDATVTFAMPDSTKITEAIKIRSRGNFRKTQCYMPSLMLNFHNSTSPRLYQLDKLKMVSGCGTAVRDEQLVLKEYLAYKMFNLVSPLSFRVRLMRVTFEDVKGKIRKYTTWGFFIEDVDMMAKRNQCKEYEVPTEQRRTEPMRMTMVSVFEYLVGNTDWSVPNFHNIKLVMPRKDSLALPLSVPYDFDFAGMVDAGYATPAELIGTETVKERVYRGFAQPMEVVEPAVKIMQDNREEFNKLINSFEYLPAGIRKDMVKYLDEFYDAVKSRKDMQRIFIDNTRDK